MLPAGLFCLLAATQVLAEPAASQPASAGWRSWINAENPWEVFWVLFGFAGQACFMMRFVYQWFVSERQGRVVVPTVFWYFSLMGGTMLFIYALHRQDPVFTVAQGLGITIYVRNLMLIYRRRPAEPAAVQQPDGEALDT